MRMHLQKRGTLLKGHEPSKVEIHDNNHSPASYSVNYLAKEEWNVSFA